MMRHIETAVKANARGRCASQGALSLAAFVLVGACHPPPTATADLEPIVREAITRINATAPKDEKNCIRPTLLGPTFERWREYQENRRNLELNLVDPQLLDWQASAVPLDDVESLKIEVVKAVATNGSKRPSSRIRTSWVEAPAVVATNSRDLRNCVVHAFTQPVVSGDWAFVEDNFLCGPVCGGGRMMALRRRENGWKLAATAISWNAAPSGDYFKIDPDHLQNMMEQHGVVDM